MPVSVLTMSRTEGTVGKRTFLFYFIFSVLEDGSQLPDKPVQLSDFEYFSSTPKYILLGPSATLYLFVEVRATSEFLLINNPQAESSFK